jgi:hypothetical protein
MRFEQALQNVAHQADTKASMVKVGAVRQDHA